MAKQRLTKTEWDMIDEARRNVMADLGDDADEMYVLDIRRMVMNEIVDLFFWRSGTHLDLYASLSHMRGAIMRLTRSELTMENFTPKG